MKQTRIHMCARPLLRNRSTIGSIWRLAALPIVLVVAGCGTGTHEAESLTMNTRLPTAANIGSSGKAIVIFAAEHKFETLILKNQSGTLDLVFASRRPITVVEMGKPVSKRFVTFRNKGRAKAIALAPGEYSLISLSYFIGGDFRYRTAGWSRKTRKPTVFGFKVSTGEVVYIGHLVTLRRAANMPLFLEIQNKPSEAKKALKVAYPGQTSDRLIGKMRTRLLQVPKTAW